MISAMRNLALTDLRYRFKEKEADLSELRRQYGAEIRPLLVESSEKKISRVYVLQKDLDRPDVVRMRVEEMNEDKQLRLPFMQRREKAIGPVIKRTYDNKKGAGPTSTTQNNTIKHFTNQANGEEQWNGYFQELVSILDCSTLHWQEKAYPVGKNETYDHILAAAIDLIPEKETVFLTVVDSNGQWPGERSEYQSYLAQVLAEMKYLTGQAPMHLDGTCPLCATKHTSLYPNALKGAGINLENMDRAGAFPGIDTSQAWKGYSLCLDCADLLYIFKNHMCQDFIGMVAGSKALLLPFFSGNPEGSLQLIEDFKDYVRGLEGKRIKALERNVMEFYAGRDDAQLVLHLMWAKFGQVIDEVTGTITDILPSRLKALADLNAEANKWDHPLAPKYPLEEAQFNLSLGMFASLFKRPGGKKAKQANASARLRELKRQLATALYLGKGLGDADRPFRAEVMTTARWYLTTAISEGNAWGLLNEGLSTNKKRTIVYWTLAGWIRHLSRFLDFLRKAEVLPMENTAFSYKPEMAMLKPYFSSGSGIDSHEKAYAFLLGILYGKVLQVQGARGVNVASNALTWLKRLNLSGRDLPELYVKMREKLLAYGVEGNKDIRTLEKEIARLGILLGDKIVLDTIPTCYFLLLGQSIMTDILKTKNEKEGANDD
jgi:CRISPR-associated protein Csh1